MDKILQIKTYVENELKETKDNYNLYQEQHKGKGFDDEVIGSYECRITTLEDILDTIQEIMDN